MSYPTSPGFRTVGFRSRTYDLMSESITGRMQVRSLSSQRWEFTAVYPPMNQESFKAVSAFIASRNGRATTFTIAPRGISGNIGTASGAMLTTGTGAIGATTIGVSLTGILPAGSVFKFAGHPKVYMSTADRDGSGTLAFFPPLQSTVGSGEAVTYNNVPFTVRLANDVQEFSLDRGRLISYEVDFIEAI